MRRATIAGIGAVLLLAATLSARPISPTGADVTFTGLVLDARSNQPVAGAQVVLDGSRYGGSTDHAGVYAFTAPRAAVARRAVLVVRMIGYEITRDTVSVEGDTVRRDVSLSPAAVALDAVVVTGAAQSAARVRQESAVAAGPPPPSGSPTPLIVLRGQSGAWNTEEYDHISENEFAAVLDRPLSTFSIDVDRASYSNVRRFLTEGQRPPIDAVRIEEMINYFDYGYPDPRGEHPFTVTTETGPAPWRPEHRLVRIGLRSPAVDVEDLPPSNLVFLIDVSGSMSGPDRLPLVQRSLRLLVQELRPVDRVAIVVYAGAAGLVLPSTAGSEQATILEAIDRLGAGGSTAGGAGIRLAYEVARRNHVRGGNNRVILATDGDFNVGASSTGELVRLIEEKRREGTSLTILGFGRGNLNDSLMEQLTGHGDGNYSYIDSLLEARKALVAEMGGTLLTVAADVKLQVEFNPAAVASYRLIGYENRLLADEDFNDDTKDAGEMGAGHTVTALYEIVPVGATTAARRDVDPLRYQTPRRAGRPAGTGELAFVKVRYKRPGEERSRLLEQPILDTGGSVSADFSFVAAVAGFGMLLRESEHAGDLTPERVLALARAGRGVDRDGYRAELIRLVELYGAMGGRSAGR